MKREPALTLIIAYKIARATLALLGSIGAFVLMLAGLTEPLQRYAQDVHDHAVSALALKVTELLLSAIEGKHLVIIACALGLDGVVLLLEGWALFKGWGWGVWLVAAASSALVPFEGAALAQHPSIIKVLVLVTNAAIVAWLFRHAIRHHRARRAVS